MIISGTLPGLVACESLQLMNVAFNSISGSLPDTYALLTQLQEMYVYVGCESAKHHTHTHQSTSVDLVISPPNSRSPPPPLSFHPYTIVRCRATRSARRTMEFARSLGTWKPAIFLTTR